MFEDKTLVCKDCGKEFVWTAGEQEFYASRGFENQPQRCKPCRDARKNGGARSNSGERQMFDAVCAACGKACKVPFQPREDRPVYCSDCFARMKQNSALIFKSEAWPPLSQDGGGFLVDGLALSVSLRSPAPPKWEPLAVLANLIFMPRPRPSGEVALRQQ